MPTPPIIGQWNGEAMIPLRNFKRTCDSNFVVGEKYRIEVVEPRSMASHRHFFAVINETWENLPDNLLLLYPTAEHLRKRALIEAGACSVHTHVFNSKAEALRCARALQPMDEFAVVLIRENTVTVYQAKSQALKAMKGKDFQDAKDKVLTYLSGLIGTTPAELDEHAKEGTA